MRISNLPLMCIVLLITLSFVGVVGATSHGCTPGFWKNNPQLWPAEIRPGAQLFYGNFNLNTIPGPDTNMQALNYGGGTGIAGMQRNLLRAAVAAKLNELTFTAWGGYEFPADEYTDGYVIWALTQDRLTMETAKNTLDAWNNLGCPLAASASL